MYVQHACVYTQVRTYIDRHASICVPKLKEQGTCGTTSPNSRILKTLRINCILLLLTILLYMSANCLFPTEGASKSVASTCKILYNGNIISGNDSSNRSSNTAVLVVIVAAVAIVVFVIVIVVVVVLSAYLDRRSKILDKGNCNQLCYSPTYYKIEKKKTEHTNEKKEINGTYDDSDNKKRFYKK